MKFFLENEKAALTAYYNLKKLKPESDEVLFIEDFFADFDRQQFLQEFHD